jgi:hypothetical protein
VNNLEIEIKITDSSDIIGEKEEKVNTTMCLFHNTLSVYTDCCTESSIGVCDMLMIMFFVSFVIYAFVFIKINNKQNANKEVGGGNWLLNQGMYLNVFSFQMMVLLCKEDFLF